MARYEGYDIFNKEAENVLYELNEALKDNKVIEGKIVSANNGGFVVDFKSFPCFLPMSEATNRIESEIDLVNFLNSVQSFTVKDIRNKSVILTRKECLKEKYGKLIIKEISNLKSGDKFSGIVRHCEDFGVFIFKEYSQGLLHIDTIITINFKLLEKTNKKLIGKVLKQVFPKKSLVNVIVNRLEDNQYSLILDESMPDKKIYISKIKEVIESDPEFLPLKQELESLK